MSMLRTPWIFGIILGVSFVYALPYNTPKDGPPNHILPRQDPPIRLTVFGYSFNATTSECVADSNFKIAQFFALNYVTHAFTLRTGAGYKASYSIMFSVIALFLPYYGLLMACRSMESWAMDAKGSLEHAGRASALCVVARTKYWRPRHGEKAWCWRSSGGKPCGAALQHYAGLELEYLSQDYVQIHGKCRLLEDGEYLLARLPTDYEVRWGPSKEYTGPENMKEHKNWAKLDPSRDSGSNISSSYSTIKPLIALIQLLAAIPTIYASHKHESRTNHGYAGYQLTIIPFALMSVINTLATLSAPTYNASYMIRSSIMDEAEKRGAIFDGVVGELCESTDEIRLDFGKLNPDKWRNSQLIGGVGVCEEVRKRRGSEEAKNEESVRNEEVSEEIEEIIEEVGRPEVGRPEVMKCEAPDMDIVQMRFGDKRTVEETSTIEETAIENADEGRTATIHIEWNTEPKRKKRKYFTKEGMKENGRSIQKVYNFVFKQQIWEAVREEVPILRWILGGFASRDLDAMIITGQEDTGKSKNCFRRLFERFRNDRKKRDNKGTGKSKITRLNPHMTCLRRLFKRFKNDDKNKDKTMVLFPAIGNPELREKCLLEDFMYYTADLIFLCSIVAPYLITYYLTGYKKGKSTPAQRVIVILWLVLMQLACIPQRLIWNYMQTRLVAPSKCKEETKNFLTRFWEKKVTNRIFGEKEIHLNMKFVPGDKNMRRALIFIAVASTIYSIPGMLGFVHVFILMADDVKGECNGASKLNDIPPRYQSIANPNSERSCRRIGSYQPLGSGGPAIPHWAAGMWRVGWYFPCDSFWYRVSGAASFVISLLFNDLFPFRVWLDALNQLPIYLPLFRVSNHSKLVYGKTIPN